MPQATTTRYSIAKTRQVAANSKPGDSLETPKLSQEPVSFLDMAAAEPVPAAVVVGGISTGDGALTAANPEEADQGRDEPEKCREEAEGDGCLELAALISMNRMDVAPVEHATTRISNQLEVKS